MKYSEKDEPNLEEVLSKGFAEMKVGEENIVIVADDERPSETQHSTAAPIEYGKVISAVEDRESFVVAPTQPKKLPEEQDPVVQPAQQKILKSPTSQLGDDFDVDW